MKKNKILYGVGILILILITYLIVFYEEEDIPFNKIEFTEGNRILNRDMPKYMDTIVLAGLSQLNITNTIIVIRSIQIKKTDDLDLKAYIIKQGETYVIFIKDLSKNESMIVMSHELIHLQQIASGKMLSINAETWLWNGCDMYSLYNLPEYLERPWEAEAFKISPNLQNKIETIL